MYILKICQEVAIPLNFAVSLFEIILQLFLFDRGRLKKMRGGKSKNIMDQMMEMMEKYANNLEDVVNDRTRLLCEEKKKTEDLLHRMLVWIGDCNGFKITFRWN